jgi:hypothetical protein
MAVSPSPGVAPPASSLGPLAAPAVIAAAATAFYIIMSSPAIGWRDGPEFTVTSVYLDIGHPSGFPVYSLLAKIFTWIPLGSIGFRVTVFTALAGGFSLFLFSLLLSLLHSSGGKPEAFRWLLGPLSIFALHQAVFAASTELEVYTLNTAFILALLFFAAKWNAGYGISWLYAGGFLYGVSCGNHAAMSLYLPVLLLLTYWGEPESEKNGGRLRHLARTGLLALFFLAGLSVYLYLLVRSMTGRLPIDFGMTDTLERFWLHVSDAKDKETHFQGLFKLEEIRYTAPIQFRNLCSPLVLLSVPFFAWGLRSLWNGFRILSVAIPAIIFIDLLFFYYWIDGTSAFLPAITAWFIPVCLGLGEMGRALRGRKILSPMAAGLTAAIVSIMSVSMALERSRESDVESGFQSTELYLPDLAAIPPESMAVHDNGWFPMIALQHAYSARPDVTLVLLTGLAHPSYMAYPKPSRMPLAFFPTNPDGSYMAVDNQDFPYLFFLANLTAGRRVFFQYGTLVNSFMPYLVPDERYMWLGEMKMDHLAGTLALDSGQYDRFLDRAGGYWERLAGGVDGPLPRKAPAYMYYTMFPVLEYMYANGRYAETAASIERFLGAFADPSVRTFLPYDVLLNCYALQADSMRKAGDFEKALEIVNRLISIRPYRPSNYVMLGYIHQSLGNVGEAMAAWRQAVELDPLDSLGVVHYGLALARYSSLAEGQAFLESSLPAFINARMFASAEMIARQRDCLLLPPWETGFANYPPAETPPGGGRAET